MNHYSARSKGTWGREEQKSPEELNRICRDFFEKLIVPKEWKDMGWSNIFDLPPTPSEGGGESAQNRLLLSVGKLFRDMRTSGVNLMHYRIFFNSFSQKGGVCSKTIIDFGKFKYNCLLNNKSIDKLNEWIDGTFKEIKTTDFESTTDETKSNVDETDGLQHFRDRFGD
jgi:hypothetical protein